MRVKLTKFACDFCSKTQDDAKALIRGPKDVCICDECVALSAEIIANKGAPPEAPAAQAVVTAA
jgi:ATP-dependent protease Clp ATPase subunit